MLDKTFRPDEVEAKHYAAWEEAGAFAAGAQTSARPYTIMMPPPNVTGSLHMGHALTFTLQDVLIRYHRMRGRDALWQPGTDHAGIATQMVVERQLEAMGQNRHQLGRADFIRKVWEWKAESGGAIISQLRRLGASPDWPRERFTMDEGLSTAVRKVFVQLHREGLIYRDKRLVNWDPKLHTAISDLEVEPREVRGQLWHFRYPIEGQPGRFIVVATTRPETMLGDTAVAVHPDDERYQDLVGCHVMLPLVGRRIPIVADLHADPETGSGAVKITPAHDFNDFEVGRRHKLEMINIFDENAHLNDDVPEAYRGLDRFKARAAVVAAMQALDLVEKIDDHTLTLPYGDRSGVVIEPWLTDQWYVDAATLAKPAIEAVETGKTVFVPKQWESTYFDWMRNIQPWCISRQIWWGHQVPAWYGSDGKVFVAETEEEAATEAARHYGVAVPLKRDEDVLDTWFSSALWPFSTLGWPERTPELERYYPGDVLVTGFDIIFFWVARMMMMGLHFMGDVPFRTVYIHALVRDELGQKMSKSKGNIIDPLELIGKYGCDALRFTLCALAAPGRDVKLAESRVEGYRNFATKLWNATRFCQMNGCALDPKFDPLLCQQKVNRWIISRLAQTARSIEAAMADYRFNEAANAIYHFLWGEFCDWYLEFTKPVLAGDDAAAARETRAATAWVLDQVLHLLHPFMPFLTEELWQQTGGPAVARAKLLMLDDWPSYYEGLIDETAIAEFTWVTELVTAQRSLKSENNVPSRQDTPYVVVPENEKVEGWLTSNAAIISATAHGTVSVAKWLPTELSAQAVIRGAQISMPLAGVIDVAQEEARLSKELDKATSEVTKIEKKLGNAQFIAKAPPEVVEEQRQRLADATQARDKLAGALERLAAL